MNCNLLLSSNSTRKDLHNEVSGLQLRGCDIPNFLSKPKYRTINNIFSSSSAQLFDVILILPVFLNTRVNVNVTLLILLSRLYLDMLQLLDFSPNNSE